jgi:hypothetical protein
VHVLANGIGKCIPEVHLLCQRQGNATSRKNKRCAARSREGSVP